MKKCLPTTNKNKKLHNKISKIKKNAPLVYQFIKI